jgi:hypothetical protein
MSNRIGIGIDVFGAGIDADATTIYNRIIADSGVSDLTRLNFFVKGLKAIYGSLANVPVCYDAHWIGYKLGSGTGATAGQAAAKLYSLTVAGDAVQTTAASQPLLLAHNGVDNYWWGSGVSGNYCSTPNAVANQITGDIEIKVTAKYIFNASYAVFVAKWGASQSFRFYIAPNDKLTVEFGGMTGATSTIAITSVMNHFKLTRNSSNGNILFYYSNEAITTDINSVTWIQLGTTVVGGTGAFTSSTNTVTIGQDGSSNPFTGKIYRATISNSIGGTPVVDFNPATYNASTSQTAWTSATGEVWTINESTTATGYKGVLVDRTIMQADGVDDKLINITASVNQPNTNYLSFKSIQTSVATQWMIDGFGSTTRQIINKQNATTIRLYAGSFAPGTSTNLDKLMLISAKYNSTSSAIYKNNVLLASGVDAGTQNLGGVVFFGDFATSYSQGIINTFLSTTDNTKLTETYNLIRSLNNNAF